VRSRKRERASTRWRAAAAATAAADAPPPLPPPPPPVAFLVPAARLRSTGAGVLQLKTNEMQSVVCVDLHRNTHIQTYVNHA